MDIEKIMESMALQKIRGIREIKRALVLVEKYIKTKELILYGGMAIDFSLKAAGKQGIYTDDVIPDFDFFSSNNFLDSYNLARILHKEGFTEVGLINAVFPLTRRVRIDKAHYVADVSYYPEPYFSKIPVMKYNSFLFVHPDFQRIDLHRSLSFLYENAPRENFRGRMKKDIKRFGLIDKNIPIGKNYVKGKKIGKEYFISVFSDSAGSVITLENVIPQELAATNSLCACGELAYFLYTEMIETICAADKTIPLPEILRIDKVQKKEFLTEEFMTVVDKHKKGTKYYEKLFDIFPESAVFGNIILYNNQRQLVAASFVERIIKNTFPAGFAVCNIHYTMAHLLLKYFFLGDLQFLEMYKNCREIIIWAEAHLYKNEKLIMDTPFFVNGTYFGKSNYSAALMLEKKMQACIIAKKKFFATPVIQFNPATECPSVDYSKYVAYKMDGIESDHPIEKKFDCDEDTK